MMKEENNIDKLFREKLKDFSETPPAFVWEGIKDTMAAGRRSKRMAAYSWSAVAALLVLAFVAGWYFNESSEKRIPQTTVSETVPSGTEGWDETRTEPVVASPENNKEADVDENAEFLAAAGENKEIPGEAEKETGAGKVEETAAIAVRNETLSTGMLKSYEANLNAVNDPQPDTERLAVAPDAGISAHEKAIVERNAAAYEAPAGDNSGWEMGVNVSPGYSSYASKYSSTYASNMTQVADEGNANLSGGIGFRYRTSKRWSLESGIYYAQNGKQTGSSPQVFAGRADAEYSAAPERLYFNTAVKMDNNNVAMNSIAGIIEINNMPAGAEIAADLENSGFYGNSLITQGEISQVFDLVEIPLYLRYLIVESKLDVEILGGLNAGVIVGNRAFIDNQFGVQKIGKTLDISTMNLSGTVGLGFTYALGEKFSIGLEPRFNYYLNSISDNPEVEFRPYRLGLYTGLYYSF